MTRRAGLDVHWPLQIDCLCIDFRLFLNAHMLDTLMVRSIA